VDKSSFVVVTSLTLELGGELVSMAIVGLFPSFPTLFEVELFVAVEIDDAPYL
jgi:hypothetical protein